MAVIQKGAYNTYYGSLAERNAFTSMRPGDYFVTTDENKKYTYNGTAWALTPNELTGSKTGKPVSETLTRGNYTDAYAALDVVSDSTSAPTVLAFENVGAAGETIAILGATMRIDTAAVPSGCSGYKLHLYNAAPTAIADNAAFNLPSADRAKYLGFITISTPSDLGDTLWSQDDGINKMVALAGNDLYGILQTIGAYTPTASIVNTITLAVAPV